LPDFSPWLAQHPAAQHPDAKARIRIATARLPNVLEREVVACQKTLEQKISDQGPNHMRVDPHLLGLAIQELTAERRILTKYKHSSTHRINWYANARTLTDDVHQKLDKVAPLYAQVAIGDFGNFLGDALEVIVFKTLRALNQSTPRYTFNGAFDLTGPRTKENRYRKIEPPQVISGHETKYRADFILYGFESGPLCIECKNYREWIYPHHEIISNLIVTAAEMRTTPLLIARRIHYTTITNFLKPAGILAHETYYQYYPAEYQDLAKQAKHKRSLGFSDIRATEEPEPRTLKFFQTDLPKVVDDAAERFKRNRDNLLEYAREDINLAQLYTAIDSPAGGKWLEPEDL